MTRWTLSRAGIVNVYQYDDEVLEFGGGRLLLRGVNGSGKSTAMNMLLPFLIDADVRRIDAAGEQSQVLRSWMLAGREEAQPVGYLWIEVVCGDEFVVCGCGIRANRSTDRVSTWWFVTERRPHVDLRLVESRVPLSADALRAEIGAHAVFAHEQRAGYRAEVRRRLYGGADIDQHLRLLHIVRSPRVGDRIDVDLPSYLVDALPQLSDQAVDDAAQPLEDLEEHRRNVEQLARTSTALGALTDVYRAYVRAEVLGHAGRADDLVAAARRADRQARRAHEEAAAAETEQGQIGARVRDLEAESDRLDGELRAMRESELFGEGRDMDQLRLRVEAAGRSETAMAELKAGWDSRLRDAATSVARTAATERDEEGIVRSALDELAGVATDARLALTPAAMPVVPAETVGVDDQGVDVIVATADLDVASLDSHASSVRAASQLRVQEAGEVRSLLRMRGELSAALVMAEREVAQADQELASASDAAEQSRAALRASADALVSGARAWAARHGEHCAAHGIVGAPLDDVGLADVVSDPGGLIDRLRELAAGTAATHAERAAALEVQREQRELERAAAQAECDRLGALSLPDPPIAEWQRRLGPCVAELVDFAEGVPEASRAGLEAALEASGLLLAEVRDGGLVAGDLVVRPGRRVSPSLRELLTTADATLGAVLECIGTSVDADAEAVVTIDGTFRLGPVRGRHAKAEAEHVGVMAQRARLERDRAAAAKVLTDVDALLAEIVAGLERERQASAALAAIARGVPSASDVLAGRVAVEHADGRVERAVERQGEADRGRAEADAALAEAEDRGRRTAATFGLPFDTGQLDGVDDALRALRGRIDALGKDVRSWARAVSAWRLAGAAWQDARSELARAATAAVEAAGERRKLAAELATKEDALGVPLRELLATIKTTEAELGTVTDGLARSRDDKDKAVAAAATAVSNLEARTAEAAEAEARAVALMPLLRRVVTVEGLADSLGGDAGVPAVPDSPAGLATLAGALRALAGPSPANAAPMTAESIRQSLRQRRDSLGAGWDAEDRQPDPLLPLSVEVNGPLGRLPLPGARTLVHEQHQRAASLLDAKQDQALRNLLQGLVAKEVADKMEAARDLVRRMNSRLDVISTSHGIGTSLRWRRSDDIDGVLATMISLLSKQTDLRTGQEDDELAAALAQRLDDARRSDPELPYRTLIARELDYRRWFRLTLLVRRPGRDDEVLSRRTALSEGEKKMVSYLALFAAVAGSCDALAERSPDAPRFVLLDDAFAKVSEDNHPKLWGLLVDLDLDVIATSERLWGTHATVPELAITEVVRDAQLGVIVLEHARWTGRELVPR